MAAYIPPLPQYHSASHAPWACHPLQSRGRLHDEPDAPTRGAFQRDRDRIVHSSAFRRLVYKTQVFVNHEGDLFRTRLTHSLEVAQLGRSIARALGLDEDLVEAIALSHDLGHTPFGHAGQGALNACMREHGGFEHNLQSLRVVDFLEQRYAAFDGLNLSFETREGILKHCSRSNAEQLEAQEPNGVGQRFLIGQQPSLEAQLCNLADEIAYNAHDVDDGMRSGLLQWDEVLSVPLVQRHYEAVMQEWPQLTGRRVLYETIRRMLSEQVYDVMQATHNNIEQHRPNSVDDVRQCPPLLTFSPSMKAESQQLKKMLFHTLYRHSQVVATMDLAQDIITDLFACYCNDVQQMKPAFAQRQDVPRAVADYIAGMTDRFAAHEHHRLTGKRLLPATS